MTVPAAYQSMYPPLTDASYAQYRAQQLDPCAGQQYAAGVQVGPDTDPDLVVAGEDYWAPGGDQIIAVRTSWQTGAYVQVLTKAGWVDAPAGYNGYQGLMAAAGCPILRSDAEALGISFTELS